MSITPVFIFSAPRSGSTLVQRVLAAHEGVATSSEPWILLPMLTPLRDDVPAGSGRDALVREALEDFVRALPGGRADYLAAVRSAALDLYQEVGGPDARWFVDKTPLYHLVVDEIVEAFPEGRFVFLWRNPLSVVASTVELFDAGRWEVGRYTMALFESVEDLVAASQRHADVSHSVRFEELVGEGEAPWRALLEYVGVPFEPEALERFADIRLEGRKGDPTGQLLYRRLDPEPLEKWRGTINTSVRKAWCRRYLRWIGDDRLSHMGYDPAALLTELDTRERPSLADLEDAGRLAASLLRDSVKWVVPQHSGGRSAWADLVARRR